MLEAIIKVKSYTLKSSVKSCQKLLKNQIRIMCSWKLYEPLKYNIFQWFIEYPPTRNHF